MEFMMKHMYSSFISSLDDEMKSYNTGLLFKFPINFQKA